MTWRVRDRQSFARLRAEGRRARSGSISVTAAGTDEPPRIAFSVGRNVGNAVVRNRVKRRLRAVLAARARDGRVASGTYLVGAGTAASSATYEDLSRMVDGAFAKLRASSPASGKPR